MPIGSDDNNWVSSDCKKHTTVQGGEKPVWGGADGNSFGTAALCCDKNTDAIWNVPDKQRMATAGSQGKVQSMLNHAGSWAAQAVHPTSSANSYGPFKDLQQPSSTGWEQIETKVGFVFFHMEAKTRRVAGIRVQADSATGSRALKLRAGCMEDGRQSTPKTKTSGWNDNWNNANGHWTAAMQRFCFWIPDPSAAATGTGNNVPTDYGIPVNCWSHGSGLIITWQKVPQNFTHFSHPIVLHMHGISSCYAYTDRGLFQHTQTFMMIDET